MMRRGAAELGGPDAAVCRPGSRRTAAIPALVISGLAHLLLLALHADPVWLALSGGAVLMLTVLVTIGLSRDAARARAALADAHRRTLASLGHEIRTPLNGVVGMLQAMERDRLDPIQRERLRAARESGRALAAAVGDVLDLADAGPREGARRVPPAAPAEAEPRPCQDLAPARVLAAEDNPMNQLVLKTLLGQHGIEPVFAANGAEAVAAWRREPFDVILMDVQMPEMDGAAATRLIRTEEAARSLRRTPIVALTANAMAAEVEGYLAAGMDHHVAKPVEAALLLDAIAAALEESQARSDAAA